MISGQLRYRGEVERSLEPGSYFGSGTTSLHEIAAEENEVIVYIRTNGAFGIEGQDAYLHSKPR